MVDIVGSYSTMFQVDLYEYIRRMGFINGNKGKFEIWEGITDSANIYPGMPLLRGTTGAAADGDHVVETGANAEVAFAIAEVDWEQLAKSSSLAQKYDSGDLIPILPMPFNPGMIFQGWVLDTDGNKNPDTQYDAGAGGFAIADLANKAYAGQLNYVADIDETEQHLMLYLLSGGHGG